jgi:hypothetical protein
MSTKLRVLAVLYGVIMILVLSGCFLLGQRAESLVSDVSDIVEDVVAEPRPTEEPAPTTETETEAEAEAEADLDDYTAVEPTESESAAPVEATTDDEEANQVNGFCVHPYFPVIEGQVWQYRSYDEGNVENAETFEISFTEIEGDQFTSVHRFFDPAVSEDMVFIESTWTCTEEGLLQVDFPAFQFGDTFESISVDYETLEVSGITFPQPDQFVEGSTWELAYSVSMMTTIEEVGTYASTTTLKQTSEIIGFETVEVPAGIFENALRVESRTEMEVTVDVEGSVFTLPTTFTQTSWYAKGIGLLLSLTEADLGSGVTELVSIQPAE